MKAILPILICSAISAGLGYYFGHITVPASQEAPGKTTASVPTPTPAYEPPVVQETTPTAPTPTAPAPAPVVETAPPAPIPAVTETPSAEETAYAERAALPIQTLTDTQGRTIQANIVKVTMSDVTIRRSDGLETTIPLSMLSADDLAFCNYIREQESAKKESTPAIKADEFDWDAYFNS